MDKQLRLAQISKWGYKLTMKPKLYRFGSGKNKSPEKMMKIRKRIKRFVPKDDALVCLPYNHIEINKEIEREGNTVLPSNVVDHFIDQSGYRAIMNYCICRESNGCKDYPIDHGCLFLGEAARHIHPEMHRSVTKEEAKAYIRDCNEKGLVHLVGRAKLDTLWLDIGPHEKLFTVCNCCPCCCISMTVPYIPPLLTDWFSKMPGMEIEVTDDCNGCEKCQDKCIYGGLEMTDGRAFITDKCRGCGRCAEACPSDAIKITMDEDSVQKTIDFLAPRVDVS